MSKVNKKFLMERAINKYTEAQLESAIHCKITASLLDWKSMVYYFNLTNRGKKSKSDKIRTEIRWFLLNYKTTESKKKLSWDTSSANIQNIKIKLKFK